MVEGIAQAASRMMPAILNGKPEADEYERA
jgi:hypothetical protein